MAKFFILWLTFTFFFVSFGYLLSVTSKTETKKWGRRVFVIGAVVAIVLSFLMFLEGNL
jgi:hypothetical protein